MSSRQRKNKPAKRRAGKNRARNGLRNIPQMRSNILYHHTFRFTSTNAAATAITSKGLLFAAGAVGTVLNTTVSSFHSSVKLHNIKVWTPPPSQGATATCSVEFYMGGSSSFSNTREYSDTSVSTAVPAFLNCSPPRDSLASFWNLPAAADSQLFILTAPVGSVIDVSLSMVINDDEGTTQTRAVSTALLGSVYFLSLDNSTGHIYPPVSLTTTF